MTDDKITILMATYMGGEHLKNQIDSILTQTHKNWELLIRDDCSSDITLALLVKYSQADYRIKIIPNNNKRLGASQNFSTLMCLPEISEYIMFCDQDDVWFSSKIENSLKQMKILEERYGKNQHYLVYGSYILINESGEELGLPTPDYSTFPSLELLLSQNYLYGCTMLINKSLLNMCAPVSDSAENHDYWIALTAVINNAYFAYINEPLLYYRQHSHNVSGSYTNAFLINRLKRIFSRKEVILIDKRRAMFASIYKRFKSEMSNEKVKLIEGFLSALRIGGYKAFKYCIKHNIRRVGIMQSLLFYFNIFRTTKDIAT